MNLSRILILACSLVALGAWAAAPAAPAGPAAPATTATAEPAKLVIAGRTVVTLRVPIFGHTPAARAEGARQRLIAAWERNNYLTLSVRMVAEGAQVLGDSKPMFMVLDGDVDTLGGETAEATAHKATETLRTIVTELSERKDPGALARGGGLALAATLFWLLMLRFIYVMDRRVGLWAERRLAEHVQSVGVSGVSMLDSNHFIGFVRAGVHALAWVLVAVVCFLWLNATLESVPYTRPWGQRLTSLLVDALSAIGGGILDAIPGLLFVVLIAVIARVITQAGRVFFERVQERNLKLGWLDSDTAAPTRMVFTVCVWLFALAMAYPYLPGSESRAFQGVSVLLGLMISLGASSTVGQAASGLILMYSRAYRPGEFVRIQETEGTVTELGLFVTRIRTGLGEEVVFPNNIVLGNSSKNYSRAFPGTGFVLDTVVTIGYDTPWRQVEAMLIEAARRTPNILGDPAPRVFQTGLSDFYPEYRLVAYSIAKAPLPRAESMSQLHANIQDVFNEHGVQIMSPHYLGDPEQAKIVPKERWFEAPARKP